MHKIKDTNTNTISTREKLNTRKIGRSNQLLIVTIEGNQNKRDREVEEKEVRSAPLGSLMNFFAGNAMATKYRRSDESFISVARIILSET